MDVKKARELIGETNVKYSDEQIVQMIEDMRILSSIIIDEFYKMTPEERKSFKKV